MVGVDTRYLGRCPESIHAQLAKVPVNTISKVHCERVVHGARGHIAPLRERRVLTCKRQLQVRGHRERQVHVCWICCENKSMVACGGRAVLLAVGVVSRGGGFRDCGQTIHRRRIGRTRESCNYDVRDWVAV